MCLRTRNTEWVSTYFALSENSGEVNRPTPVLSQTFDASRVVARLSTFVSRLLLLEGEIIRVRSLLTSMRDLGS